MKIRRSTFQHVESELYSYHDTCREIVRLKNDILYGRASGDDNVGGGRGSMPGDPTGRTATLLVTHRKLEMMERTAEAIEFIYGQLPEDKKQLVEIRYWARPQTLTWEGIAQKLKISCRQAQRWRDDIVLAVAARIGLR